MLWLSLRWPTWKRLISLDSWVLNDLPRVKRRFSEKQIADITVIDDYAHHPTEIKATLTAAQKYPHPSDLVRLPATYLYTYQSLFSTNCRCTSLADKIVLADIYAARETDTGDIHSRDIQKLLHWKRQRSYYFPSFEEIEKIFTWKMYQRRPVDNYGCRRRCFSRRSAD